MKWLVPIYRLDPDLCSDLRIPPPFSEATPPPPSVGLVGETVTKRKCLYSVGGSYHFDILLIAELIPALLRAVNSFTVEK